MIPFKRLNFSLATEPVTKLLESGMIGLGSSVFEFEQLLADYVGAKHVVALDSCTSALFLSLKYEKPKRVVIPSMTVPLVANAIIEAGAEIEFSADTEWVGSAYRLGNTNIYDSAHQLERNQCKNMGKDDKYCFSFYPTKPVGSGDGGAIATNDPEFAQWARSISCYGRNQTNKYQNSWEYDVNMLGYKRHYTNLQAVICSEQIKVLDNTNEMRIAIRDYYNEELGYDNTSLYLYRLEVGRRDEFIAYMKEHGIECGVHFKPLHMMTAFKDIPISDSVKKRVEAAYKRTVSIPLYESLELHEIEHIVQTINSYPQ